MLYIPIPFDDEVKQEILSAENPIEKMDELIPTEYIEGLRANTIYVYLNILLSEKSVSIDAKKLLSLYAERSQYVYGDCSAFIPMTDSIDPVIPISVIYAVPFGSTQASAVGMWVCVPYTAAALPSR